MNNRIWRNASNAVLAFFHRHFREITISVIKWLKAFMICTTKCTPTRKSVYNTCILPIYWSLYKKHEPTSGKSQHLFKVITSVNIKKNTNTNIRAHNYFYIIKKWTQRGSLWTNHRLYLSPISLILKFDTSVWHFSVDLIKSNQFSRSF